MVCRSSNNDNRKNFSILQLNLNKSLNGQLALLELAETKLFDIIILQEPHIDVYENTRANSYWNVLYPPLHYTSPEDTRSITLVNKNISTDSWRQLPINHSDVTAMQIKLGGFNTAIFNIYNDCKNDTAINEVDKYATMLKEKDPSIQHAIWAGDFNRHHPMWDDESNSHLFTHAADKDAQHLIKLTENHNLDMLLPKGIPTLQSTVTKNFTRVDNVFASYELSDKLIICDVDARFRPVCTDHFPIVTTLDLSKTSPTLKDHKNFRNTDWDEFKKALRAKLRTIDPPREFGSHEVAEAEKARVEIERVVNETIAEVVPSSSHYPHSKRWWTQELTSLKRRVQHLQVQHFKHRADANNAVHEECRRTRNQYSQLIKDTKRDHWEDWLSGLDGNEVWKASKMIQNGGTDGGRTRIPDLKIPNQDGTHSTTSSNEEKSKAFFEAFFPKRTAPPAPNARHHPPPKWEYETTSDEQILRIIKSLKPYKASSSGSAPNSVFTHNPEILIPYLGPIYRALDTQRRYPDSWKITETVIIKKPKKPNYTITGAYRPITLSNGFSRIINMCKTEDLAKNSELHNVLPPNHFGGRPGRSTTDSIHSVIKTIKDAWRNKKVASMLFLDVKGAFPSVAMDVLLWELKRKGIPQEHIDWIERRNSNRRTQIKFDDFQSQPFEVVDGLDQGDAQSLILYLIYNSDILLTTDRRAGTFSFTFVDDVALAAVGKNFEETSQKLKYVMEKRGGILEWARKHNCAFGIEKFQLSHYSRKRIEIPNSRKRRPMDKPNLVIDNHTISPSKSITFLGLIIDDELRWKEQGAAAVAKGTFWINQFSRLASPQKGVCPRLMRQLYLSIAIPRMLYAADIFLTPQVERKNARVNSGAIRTRLASIHGKAAVRILGGFRSSPHEVAIVHAGLLPFHLLVKKVRTTAAIRLATLPSSHPLHNPVRQAADHVPVRHITPLHDLMKLLPVHPDRMEKISAVRLHPRWIPGIATSIDSNRQLAIERESSSARENRWRVYTDGSGVEGYIGAAAVLMKGRETVATLRYRLGRITRHTVYEGEGVGILLGLELVRTKLVSRRARDSVTFGADNQAAITATRLIKAAPSHYIWDLINEGVHKHLSLRSNISLHLNWTPGHEGIDGNEKADAEAKKASLGDVSDVESLPRTLREKLPFSSSAVRQAMLGKIKKEAESLWTKSKYYARIHRFEEIHPASKFIQVTRRMHRKRSALLFQLRTGHAPLESYLFRIGKVDSPRCPNCGQDDETVFHYLIRCPQFANERARLYAEAGHAALSLECLLSSGPLTKHLFKFIGRTGRFPSLSSDT